MSSSLLPVASALEFVFFSLSPLEKSTFTSQMKSKTLSHPPLVLSVPKQSSFLRAESRMSCGARWRRDSWERGRCVDVGGSLAPPTEPQRHLLAVAVGMEAGQGAGSLVRSELRFDLPNCLLH